MPPRARPARTSPAPQPAPSPAQFSPAALSPAALSPAALSPAPPPAGAGQAPLPFEYTLQRTPVGVVILDAARRIRSANPEARRMLARHGEDLFGTEILALHPEAARAKVAWLIASAAEAPDGAASLVVTTAMGSLVAKVTRLDDGTAAGGFCMMFHALGDRVMGDPPAAPEAAAPLLLKLPVMRGTGDVTTLIDVDEVVFLMAEGHYARAATRQFTAFCPRPLAELERRLDPGHFLRVHRRHVVNIRHVRAAERADGRWHLRMADATGTRLPVSRAKVAQMRRMLAV
ncbi:LytTR family transcriptional regulator [Azorhizobium doebereinerae]|uniref:LytTR family transcriptional regulator n=1 Tax=Azorhizobium doebereinerae TaxID=281091 RepID=UPI0003F79C26|nr:PAS domain-containing transcriptional regulator [Azorhizobium doebereinerae]